MSRLAWPLAALKFSLWVALAQVNVVCVNVHVSACLSVCLLACRILLISISQHHIGKSCLIKRYCEERFVTKYIATIGVDYGVKPVKIDRLGEFRINFWDLSGHSEFFEVRNEFYKDTQGCLLVYDVTSR